MAKKNGRRMQDAMSVCSSALGSIRPSGSFDRSVTVARPGRAEGGLSSTVLVSLAFSTSDNVGIPKQYVKEPPHPRIEIAFLKINARALKGTLG